MRSPLASSARYNTNTRPSFTTAAGLKVACSSHRAMVSLIAERNRDAGLGVITGFASLGLSNGPNVQVASCPHTGWPVTQPGGNRSITRARAFRGRRLPSLSPPRRASAPWLGPRLLARRAGGPLPAAAASPAWRPPAAATDLQRDAPAAARSEEHTSELQSLPHLACRLLLEKKK